ncbi:hypothetical protein ASPZODRAFT_1035913 [Penicilliopsis zonata CBS 506.65]|uniref:Uncharacterized protein n=1 Tax=Penicilliopsis zonata CBS 506.65 TaxID=1073090 RepID=A0A1L9SRS7_9EURO|nr:hypothetical protein ASPZODRAFT_1035913 [Penicilliopsis zonata CBS 506.65]OJJ49823.1 hypothetical protein ASPZODRAFT_1035913 [Penicilliopsis zonata CBS 506.65]
MEAVHDDHSGGASVRPEPGPETEPDPEPDSEPEPAAASRRARSSSSSSSSSGHKRSLSGSLLSKLSFLRMTQMAPFVPDTNRHGSSRDDNNDDGNDDNNNSPALSSGGGGGSRAMATALQVQQQQRRTRRRRGSLRKTALLGTRLEAREKKLGVGPSRAMEMMSGDVTVRGFPGGQQQQENFGSKFITTTTTRSSGSNSSSGGPSWTLVSSRSSATAAAAVAAATTYKATELDGNTSDDEGVSFPRKTTSNNNSTNKNPSTDLNLHIATTPSSSLDSYFPDLPAVRPYRPPPLRTQSPLVTPIEMATPTSGSGTGIKASSSIISGSSGGGSSSKELRMSWDYAETEWWGWIILAVTWLVFTPYAPPELEDDPTLPIVGYYPALIILTAVMSWVWVVVAWVGMKYFKHANISGEDT